MTRTISKVIAAVTLAIAIGLFIHDYYLKRGEMTREAFITDQTKRYDRYRDSPRPLGFDISISLFAFGGLFVIYEGMAFVIFIVLKKVRAGK